MNENGIQMTFQEAKSMKRFLLATLIFATLIQPVAYAATPSISIAINQTTLLSEAQAGLADWDITSYAKHPAQLRTTTAQHLIDKSFMHFQELSPTISASEFTEIRTALRADDPAQDFSLTEKMQIFTEHLTSAKSSDRLGAWSIGLIAGELEDNATKTKNHDKIDREIQTIASLSDLDTLFPAMHNLRLSLLTLRLINPQVTDWQRLAIAAHAIRQIIAAAPTKDQTPIAGLFAMNLQTPEPQLTEKETAQIEFINADGSMKIMSSYTDGATTTSGRNIHCGIDSFPSLPENFFLPLTIPTIGQELSDISLQSLVANCEKIEGLKPSLPYQKGLITPLSAMLGLLLMTDPVDGKVVMQNIEHANQKAYPIPMR